MTALAAVRARGARSPGYQCAICLATMSVFMARCYRCGSIGHVIAAAAAGRRKDVSGVSGGVMADEPDPMRAVPLASVAAEPLAFVATGDVALDAVAGSDGSAQGFVRGGLYLLYGRRGLGKSRFALQNLAALVARRAQVIVVGSEETKERIHQRARLIGMAVPARLLVIDVLGHDRLDQADAVLSVLDGPQVYRLAIVDSASAAVGSTGSMDNWLRSLQEIAQRRRVPVIAIMHATKGGRMRGRSDDEHYCDTILKLSPVAPSFQGWKAQIAQDDAEDEPTEYVRLAADGKNRWGDTTRQAIYRHTPRGLSAVTEHPATLVMGMGGPP